MGGGMRPKLRGVTRTWKPSITSATEVSLTAVVQANLCMMTWPPSVQQIRCSGFVGSQENFTPSFFVNRSSCFKYQWLLLQDQILITSYWQEETRVARSSELQFHFKA
uniref:Uncharacterized protein n=1 Tax=Arundo donax TaxID=35708 RepID=A0A0A9DTB0_ARUDO